MSKCLAKVKSLEEIKATLDEGSQCHRLFFCEDGMSQYCGKTIKLHIGADGVFYDPDAGWFYVSEWLVMISCPYCLNRFKCFTSV